jgi:hypothetical protein
MDTNKHLSFKITAIILLLFASHAFSQSLDKSYNLDTAKDFIKDNKKVAFIENNGQFEGTDGNLASYVLFKASTSNFNVWVTTTGITYQMLEYNHKVDNNFSVIKKHSKIEAQSNIESVNSYRIDLILKGANIAKENIVKEDQIQTGKLNYYHAHSPDGVLNAKAFASITIKNIYPGIDWHLFSQNGAIEYDFIVQPGANADLIRLIYEGNGSANVEANTITFNTKAGTFKEGELFCYQDDRATLADAKFVDANNSELLYAGAGITPAFLGIKLNGDCFSKEVKLDVGNYNKGKVLIIDPKIVWGTYFGGPAPEQSRSITCDNNGNVFISGVVVDVGFPTVSWGSGYYQALFAGGLVDCFIMSFAKAGALLWSTYYGGNEDEAANAVICDANNHLYVAGSHVISVGMPSSSFPLQNLPGAFNQLPLLNSANQFLLRFNSTNGVRDWGTIIADGEARSLATDENNSIYVTGSGSVRPAVNRAGAYNDSSFAGGFDITILQFNANGSMIWATNYGGANYEEGLDIALDRLNNIYITGPAEDSLPIFNKNGAYNYSTYTGGYGDGYLLSFNSQGALTWSTYIPGTTQGTNVGCDNLGNVYLIGYGDTLLDGPMPIVAQPSAYNQSSYGGGSNDVCILKFKDSGNLSWSTYYGGTEMDLSGNFSYGSEMLVDRCDNVYISLSTLSTNPNTMYTHTTCGQYTFTGNAMGGYAYMLKLTSDNDVAWGTYYGGNGSADGWGCQLALDGANNLYACKAVYEPIVAWPLIDLGGGAFYDSIPSFNEDLHIAKFEPLMPTYTLSQVNDSSCNCGSATISLACGEPNYSYLWSNGSQIINTDSSSNTISGLAAGVYSVTAIASCGQTVTASFNILNVATALEEQLFPKWLNVYPNPSHGSFAIKSDIDFGKLNLEIYDVYGEAVFVGNYLSASKILLNLNVSSGIYLCRFATERGTYMKKIVIE